MKAIIKTLTLVFSIVVIGACAQKKTLSQKITCMQPYCGGARPTPEMEADAQKLKPYAKKTIIIISSTGKVDSVKTDKDGGIKKSLKYGTYKFFEAWKYYKKTPDGTDISIYDKACLELEWKNEFKIVTVEKAKISEEEKYQINLKCPWSLPCILEQNIPPRMHQ
jgi:hypothetical protein